MAKSRIKTEFKVNQQIVYPSQGVGKITEIFEKEFNGETVAYYKIYLEVSDMIVMVPVNNAKDLGIRAIVEASEAKKALNMLSEDFEPITSDWKLRYQMKEVSLILHRLYAVYITEVKLKNSLFRKENFTTLLKSFLKMKSVLH